MCGLVGVFSKRKNDLTGNEIDAFKDLLTIDVLRGKDSTGAVSISRRELLLFKVSTHPLNAFETNEWKDFERDARRDAKILIGHNRAATRGTVSSENAHPFLTDHICLVHNGTLWGHEKLNVTSDVDSHAIAVALSKNPNVDEVLHSLNGAYALIWYNLQTGEVIYTRNKERPLWMFESDDLVALGSEYLPLYYALGRRNIEVKDKIKPVEENIIYTFRNRTLTRRELAKPAPKVIEISHGRTRPDSEGSSTKEGTPDPKSTRTPGTSSVSSEATRVIFHLTEVKPHAQGTLGLGVIVLPEVLRGEDCKIVLTGWDPTSAEEFLDQPFYGSTVSSMTNHVNGGPMYHLSYDDLDVYPAAKEVVCVNQNVPIEIKNYIIAHHQCDECAGIPNEGNFHGGMIYVEEDGHIVYRCSACVREDFKALGKEKEYDNFLHSPLSQREQQRSKLESILERAGPKSVSDLPSAEVSKEDKDNQLGVESAIPPFVSDV